MENGLQATANTTNESLRTAILFAFFERELPAHTTGAGEQVNVLRLTPWLGLKPRGHSPRAVKRSAQVLAVQQRHQLQFVGVNRRRLIVERSAVEPQQLTLPADADIRMAWLDQVPLALSRGVPLFFSSSPTRLHRCPICW